MSQDGQEPAAEELSFNEAVKMVGRKPEGIERRDLVTLWGFERKNWRWCMDVGMTLEEAINVHRKLDEEYRIVTEKKKASKRAQKTKEQ